MRAIAYATPPSGKLGLKNYSVMKWFEIKRQPADAKRRQVWNWRIALRTALIVAVLGGAGYYGFETGLLVAGREITRLNGETDEMARALAEMERYNLVLAEAADRARVGEEQWRRRYQAAIAGKTLNKRPPLASQSAAENGAVNIVAAPLALAPAAILNAGTCEPLPDHKLFRVQTPVSDLPREVAGFDGNRIVVAAYGISALNPHGVPLGWYDPKQPVSLRFSVRDGRTDTATGILPMSHAVKALGTEYRFTLSRGKKGFVRIAGNRCNRD